MEAVKVQKGVGLITFSIKMNWYLCVWLQLLLIPKENVSAHVNQNLTRSHGSTPTFKIKAQRFFKIKVPIFEK